MFEIYTIFHAFAPLPGVGADINPGQHLTPFGLLNRWVTMLLWAYMFAIQIGMLNLLVRRPKAPVPDSQRDASPNPWATSSRWVPGLLLTGLGPHRSPS